MSISSIHFQIGLLAHDDAARAKATGSSTETEGDRQTPLEKRLQEIKEAVERLNALPPASVRMAAEKVELLKRRLEQLRATMLLLTPGQAKAMAKELKEIAGALAAAARDAGGATGLTGLGAGDAARATTTAQAAAAAQSGAAAASNAQAYAAAAKSADTASNPSAASDAEAAQASTVQAAIDKATEAADRAEAAIQKPMTLGAPAGADHKQRLRELLQEAVKMLRETLNLLKTKLQDDQEGRRAATDLKNAINDLDQHAALLGSNGLYNAQGAVNAIAGLTPEAAQFSIRA